MHMFVPWSSVLVSACRDEKIIVSALPCDLSVRRTWLVVFHLLTCIFKRILEKVVVGRCCLVNKSVVKWFAQRYTFRNYKSG